VKNGLLGRVDATETVSLEMVDQNALLFGPDFTLSDSSKALTCVNQV
jgi:hypothetical protein